MSTVTEPRQISVDLDAYLDLLIEANIFDPARWPKGMEEGAALLKRIREIEAQCIAEHGEFDWEKLSEKLQDEYDLTMIRLDDLIEPPGDPIPFEDFVAELGIELDKPA